MIEWVKEQPGARAAPPRIRISGTAALLLIITPLCALMLGCTLVIGEEGRGSGGCRGQILGA